MYVYTTSIEHIGIREVVVRSSSVLSAYMLGYTYHPMCITITDYVNIVTTDITMYE